MVEVLLDLLDFLVTLIHYLEKISESSNTLPYHEKKKC